MKALLLLFFLGHSFNGFAKTVVLKAPQSDAKDFEALVLSSPEYEFPSQAILQTMPLPEARERLAAHFAKAQTSFMEGSLLQAVEDFKAVTSLAETDQWGDEEQTVLLHSFLRLAQLSHRPEESEAILREAIVMAPSGTLDEKLFPPPLTEKFKALKENFPTVKVDLKRWRENFDFVVINGRVMNSRTKPTEQIYDGPVRVSFISDTFQPVTVETSADQLNSLVIDKKPWLEGSCLKPKMHWQMAGLTPKPFFSKHCAPLSNKQEPELDIAYHPPPPSAPFPLPITNQSSTKVPFYQRTWFWLGVGAVATVALVASLSHHETQPTTRDGF